MCVVDYEYKYLSAGEALQEQTSTTVDTVRVVPSVESQVFRVLESAGRIVGSAKAGDVKVFSYTNGEAKK